MTPVAILQGFLLSGALLCQFRMTQMATTPNGRTIAMAVHWSLCGLGGCAGALLAGVLQDQIPNGCFEALRGSWTTFDFLVLLNALICWLAVLPSALRLESEFSNNPQTDSATSAAS
jgi:predicted MFS family arabinose efflux permease